MTRARMLVRRLAAEEGYTLTELLTVLLILGTVVGALTGLFVSASRGEVDMNERFQAQQEARLALAKLRQEVHCARTATTSSTGASVTLTLPSVCRRGTGDFTWCTVALAPSRYALFRKPGTACDAAGVKVADYLTDPSVFSYTAPTATSLATLDVELHVDANPKDGRAAYRLTDHLALRNSGRA